VEEVRCSQMGVFAPLTGIIGTAGVLTGVYTGTNLSA